MAGRPSFRGRMGVDDAKHGEQNRDGMAVLGEGKNFGKPTKTMPDKQGADSKSGGEGPHSGYPETTTAGYGGHGDGNPPNTVPMPIMARGKAAPGGYRNTGDTQGLRGSIGNTLQDSYNDKKQVAMGGSGGEGILGIEKSNFYNDVGDDSAEGEGESGSGPMEYKKHIEGFGGGGDTFAEKSNFYNEVGQMHETDAECNSGSGLINPQSSGKAKTVKGFSADGGVKNGKI